MNKKYASIVFDDGPREPMREMIDKFIENNQRCGFALIGSFICDQTEAVLRYAVENGFELVSHGQYHKDLNTLSKDEIYTELFTQIDEIYRRLGYKITTARAPFLHANETVLEVCKENNLPLLGQGITVAHDWEATVTSDEISTSFCKNICDGAIVTLHVMPHTLNALDDIFEFCKAEGFELVTPSQLFKVKNINPVPLDRQITRL